MVIPNYRKDVERMYMHTCNIYIKTEEKNPLTFETEFVQKTYIKNQPCLLTYGSSASAGTGEVADVTQSIKLFIDEKIKVKEGSYIDVTVNGETTTYKQSGKPMLYPCHQVIALKVSDIA